MAAPWVWRCLKVELAERLLEMALQVVDKRSCQERQPRWEGIARWLAAVAQVAAYPCTFADLEDLVESLELFEEILAVALTESGPAVVIAVGSTLAVKAELVLELAPG